MVLLIQLVSITFNFLLGLQKEWRNISLMTKTQQSFDGYSLGDLYNVLKHHESEINEIAEEGKLGIGGPLALISKVNTKDSEIETGEQDNSEEEGFLVNSKDEVVAYYSNNKVIFFKKLFNPKYKSSSEFKGNNSLEKCVKVDLKE